MRCHQNRRDSSVLVFGRGAGCQWSGVDGGWWCDRGLGLENASRNSNAKVLVWTLKRVFLDPILPIVTWPEVLAECICQQCLYLRHLQIEVKSILPPRESAAPSTVCLTCEKVLVWCGHRRHALPRDRMRQQ